MAKFCHDLIKCVNYINSISGVNMINSDYQIEHTICDCINGLGDIIQTKSLGFDPELRKNWSSLRAITVHPYQELNLSQEWVELPQVMQALLATIEGRLK